MKRLALLVLSASNLLFAEWVELKNCRLLENSSNDADSFLVECPEPYQGKTVQRFRLYFVDAAETDRNSDFKRDRLIEQAAYWGKDDPDFALQMGLRASQYVRRLLRQPFSVWTCGEYAPTMGMPRLYVMVQADGQWLDELLVKEGLVRIHGDKTDLPDGTSAERHLGNLKALERSARSEGRNGWRGAEIAEEKQDAPDAFSAHDTVTARAVWIYSLKDGRKVTVLPPKTAVSVISSEEKGRVRVRFKKDGRVFEGLCEVAGLE